MKYTKEKLIAEAKTGFENLKSRITPDTKRMAGALLAAAMTPAALSLVDDQETSISGGALSGLIGAGGVIGGGYMGYKSSRLDDKGKDALVKKALVDLKAKSQEVAAREGPAAGIDYFGKAKAQLLEIINPVDPGRSKQFNAVARHKIPDVGGIIADLDLLQKSPREIRGMTRGAALGALAAALPSYLALRSGEVE